jgi:hypothetical protein
LSGVHSRLSADLFNSHDDFYGVETVKTEVVVEVRLGVELWIILAKSPLHRKTCGSRYL